VAFLGSIAVMGVLDVSLNMLTLFAFIVALGLVVDDAIVVGESIAAQREHAGDPAQAATRGTLRVALPVVVAVLTTILFVSPQLFVPGFFGKLVKGIAIVIISCLAFSLVESLLVLPAHLTHREHTGGGRWGLLHRLGRRADALQRATDARLRGFIERRYLPWLDRVLARPALALAVASVGVMLSVSLVAGGWVPVEFTPQVEGETVTAELELEKGTPPEVTWAALRRIEGEMIALGEAYRTEHGSPLIRHVVMSLGSDPGRHDDMKRGAPGGHVGRVRAQLVPSTGRDLKSFEIAERWRARVRDVVGAVSLRFNGEGLIDDPNVEIQLTGEDPVTLLAASEALRRHVASMPGVRQVADSHRPGKRELAISVRPEAEAFGLTQRELARQVQQGFHGERVQTLQRGRDEVAVVVRYPRSERSALGDLENVRIRTSSGGELPFARVAYAELSQGTAAIHRSDRRRSVRVTADVDPAAASPSEVLDSVLASLPGVLGPYPGVRGERSGMSRESGEVFANRTVNVVVALLVSYALFAVTLRSYLDPLLVMVAIPFGVGGAIAAHAVLGLVLSSFSMIGIIALIGVVVNDSLVLVYAAKERRLAGEPAGRALRAAAAERFRPILLTSLTTFFGLLPLLFESSSEAEWLKPVGVTLAFGVLFATGVTLIVVPAASVLLDRLRGALVLGPRTRSRVRSARAAVPRGAEEPVRRIVAAAPPA
jgi:multidrug efflux pump subunit AcrB